MTAILDEVGYRWGGIRASAEDWLRQRGCILFGHVWTYEGPGQWDWDGEGSTYCKRCCWDSDRTGFFERNPWTWGDWFFHEIVGLP